VFPHGLTVDPDGNIWVTDGQDNRPRRARGAPPDSPLPPDPPVVYGHQVYKYSPDGRLLMTLGKKGGGRGNEYFYQPNAVAIAPNGDIFVCEGHSDAEDAPARVLKFEKTGKFLKSWGKRGMGRGEFIQPHALAFDSKGRLFVGDRSNNRIQIFEGTAVRRRSQQQPDPDLRSGRDVFGRVGAVQPPERDRDRRERHDLRRRLGVRRRESGARRLDARHPDRQRERRRAAVADSRSVADVPRGTAPGARRAVREQHERGRRRRGRSGRKCLRRGSRTARRQEIRARAVQSLILDP
jgi:sugar lactone lactonase YvrE